tara:strand:- start:3300 stop:3791 length:492 start_codon:yes stop_codon:yes gene_type:complete
MGLAKDIENAFLKSMGTNDIQDKDAANSQKKKARELGIDISKAVQDFLTSVNFRVMELETELDVDEISTDGPLGSGGKPMQVETDVSVKNISGTPTPTGGGITPGTGFGQGSGIGTVTTALNLKSGGQGGTLNVDGHGRVGNKNYKKSKVKLLQTDINSSGKA